MRTCKENRLQICYICKIDWEVKAVYVKSYGSGSDLNPYQCRELNPELDEKIAQKNNALQIKSALQHNANVR